VSHSSREVRLVARPSGLPQLSDFRVAERDVPDPKPGELLVRNRWFSLDTYMRGRMSGGWSYVPPFDLDVALDGKAVGDVIASPGGTIPVGATVMHDLGWREYAVIEESTARRVDTDAAPASSYLGALGLPGLVAYAALLTVGELHNGDDVFISSAAGAVGIVAGQIAKLRGHRVIASTGSAAKVEYLKNRLGFDVVFNYRDDAIGHLLSLAAPDGIDLYLDCVGGEHLEAAIDALRPGGRIAKVGGVAEYNALERPAGPRNLMQLVVKGLTLRGLGRTALGANAEAFAVDSTRWLADGRLQDVQTVVEGIEHTPQAFIDLLSGGNLGKMVVKVV
jgi:NADPH-dependent curcumin reductase CurA